MSFLQDHILKRKGPKRWPPEFFIPGCPCCTSTPPPLAAYYYASSYYRRRTIPMSCWGCTDLYLPETLTLTLEDLTACGSLPNTTVGMTYHDTIDQVCNGGPITIQHSWRTDSSIADAFDRDGLFCSGSFQNVYIYLRAFEAGSPFSCDIDAFGSKYICTAPVEANVGGYIADPCQPLVLTSKMNWDSTFGLFVSRYCNPQCTQPSYKITITE